MTERSNLIRDALVRAGIKPGDSLDTQAIKLDRHLYPEFTVVEQTDTKLVVDITSSVDAGLFSGLTAGNQHLPLYVGESGKMNSLTRIGHCDQIVSMMYKRAILTKISLVSFRQIVQLGETVRITLEETKQREVRDGILISCNLSGCRPETDEPIFEPCVVTVYQYA